MLLSMLSDKLHQLEKYIEALDQMKPIDVLSSALESFQETQDELAMDESNKLDQFSKEINVLIQKYQLQSVPAEVLACQMYTDLLFYVRKIRILSYAKQLEIDPRLYKKQMDFLFKGKS